MRRTLRLNVQDMFNCIKMILKFFFFAFHLQSSRLYGCFLSFVNTVLLNISAALDLTNVRLLSESNGESNE